MKINKSILFSGSKIPIPSCNIVVTQPKLREIMSFNETMFIFVTELLIDAKTFIIDQTEDNSELQQLTDFEILIVMMKLDVSIRQNIKTYFDLIFPDYEINYTDTEFVFSTEDKVIGKINKDNYEDFIYTIDKAFSLKKEEDRYHPANKRAAEIAKKLEAGRKKVQGKKKTEINEETSVLSQYVSILSIGMCLDINILLNYTIFQLLDSQSRFMLKQQFDIIQKLKMTPLVDGSKIDDPEDWTKNLYG